MTQGNAVDIVDELLRVADAGDPPVTWPFDAADELVGMFVERRVRAALLRLLAEHMPADDEQMRFAREAVPESRGRWGSPFRADKEWWQGFGTRDRDRYLVDRATVVAVVRELRRRVEIAGGVPLPLHEAAERAGWKVSRCSKTGRPRCWGAVAAMKRERHPLRAVKRGNRWFATVQACADALRHTSGWRR